MLIFGIENHGGVMRGSGQKTKEVFQTAGSFLLTFITAAVAIVAIHFGQAAWLELAFNR